MIVDFGHFGSKFELLPFQNLTKNPWDYKTRAQELTSGAIRMFLLYFSKIWEHFKDGRVEEKMNSTFFCIFESTWSTLNTMHF